MTGVNRDELERFAYDVIVHTMSKFNIKTDIQPSKCRENTYEHPDFLDVICTDIIVYQFYLRKYLFTEFETRFKSRKLKKSAQISDFLMEELKKLDEEEIEEKIECAAISLALVNELVQFLYFKNIRFNLNDLARVWSDYFSRFQKEFEEEGGFSGFYSSNLKDFKKNKKILKVLPNIRYGNMSISDAYQKKAGVQFRCGIEDDHDAITELQISSNSRENSSKNPRFERRQKNRKTEASSSLENTGLGIIPHENLLQDLNALLLDKKSFSSIDGSEVTSGLTESPLSPAEQSKHRDCLTRSPLSPAKRSKDQASLTGSPLSPTVQWKNQGVRPRSSFRNAERSKDRSCLTGSPLGPAEQTKDRGGLSRTSLSPGERSKQTGSSTSSPTSPQEQNQRKSSTRTPEVISRLEQKRQKHRQRKKAEPAN